LITIGILDDHRLVREGLVRIVQADSTLEVSWLGARAEDAAEIGTKSNPQVLVLDLNLPDRSGLEVIKDLRARLPNLAILVVSMYPEEQFARRVLRAGARGYLIKDESPELLLQAIHKIAAGGYYISENLAIELATITSPGVNEIDTPYTILSDREYELFIILAEGKSVKEASSLMGVGLSTVHTYRQRLLEKLNLRTNGEIIYYAMEKGLLT